MIRAQTLFDTIETMKKAAVYTRTGDRGTTSLVGGQRVEKHSMRIEAYGTVDELNSHLGILTSHPETREADRTFLLTVQNHLFDIGSYLACDPEGDFVLPTGVNAERLQALEHQIDALDSLLPRIDRFVLPTGSPLTAECHVARAVCRRAERRLTQLAAATKVDPEVLAYINRLSDYLFILARFNNINTDHPEIFWQKDC